MLMKLKQKKNKNYLSRDKKSIINEETPVNKAWLFVVVVVRDGHVGGVQQ